MSEIIVGEVKNKKRVLVMGDFNLRPNTKTIYNIEAHFVNVFKGEMTTSFNMKHKTNPGYGTAVVDMVFASSDLKIASKSIPEDDISDHKPLLIELT